MDTINKKKRVFTIIQVGSRSDIPSRVYDLALVTAVLVNIFIALFETFPESAPYLTTMRAAEGVTVAFFTIDYILRIWTASYLYRGVSVSRARIKFIFSWAGMVDFLSCVPYYLPFFFAKSAVVLRMFRIIRILRIFRIQHYADPLKAIATVLKKKRGQLLSSRFIVLILMITASLLMYGLEHEAQPEVFSNAFSGFWWAANTLLTVGYGDMVPVTLAGKVCGVILTFLGVGMVAIPTGILSAGFVAQTEQKKEKPEDIRYCPGCGRKLH